MPRNIMIDKSTKLKLRNALNDPKIASIVAEIIGDIAVINQVSFETAYQIYKRLGED